jgi:hypothetical protein
LADFKKTLENMNQLSKIRGIRKAISGILFGGVLMEHLRTTVTTLAGLFVILGLMFFLAIGSNTVIPSSPTDVCEDSMQCDLTHQPSLGPDAGKVPTPAPPRSIISKTADNSLHTPPLGQSVYVQVKTDHLDIEVGWASSDFLGR